jgi:hypothetical protein
MLVRLGGHQSLDDAGERLGIALSGSRYICGRGWWNVRFARPCRGDVVIRAERDAGASGNGRSPCCGGEAIVRRGVLWIEGAWVGG